MKDEIKNTAASAADKAKAGYKHPPVKNRLPKGKSTWREGARSALATRKAGGYP
jgi:hypothetical protein